MKIIKFLRIFLITIAWQIAFAASSATPLFIGFTKDSGNVEFDATAKPGLLKIHGKGTGPEGKLEVRDKNISGTLSFDLASLDTGISLRNEHMKNKYLQIGQFPQTTLKISKVTLPDAIKGDFSVEKAPFEGILLLHGTEKPIQGFSKISRHGNEVKIESTFGLKTADFKIPDPSFASVKMAEDVKVTVHATGQIQN